MQTAHGAVQMHGIHTPARIVLHSTESDGKGSAYGADICAFWHRENRGYGAHFVISNDGTVTDCLQRTRIAWHVEHHNTGSIGIEQAGYAAQTAEAWMRRELELDATARLLARLHHYWGILLEPDTEHGVSTHAQQSRKYGGSHTDPGADYPMSHVLGMARSYAARGGWRGVWNAGR